MQSRARERGPLGAGWVLLVLSGLAGFAAGAGLAAVFVVVHSNWTRIPGVSADATSTVPYWLVQFLGPVLVSVCWTALLLHARSVPRGWALAMLALVIQLALLAASLIPIALAGNGGVAISNFTMPLQVLVAVACPLAAVLWPRGRRASAVGWHLLAAAAFPLCLWVAQSIWAAGTLLI